MCSSDLNVFNIEQMAGVSTQVTVDTAGYPVDPTTLTRLSLSSIPNDISYYLTNRSGYEQRKFQLGFKLTF